MIPFTHLHVHSQYSILDGAASIKGLVGKAKKDGMTALALTDHGMMFGIKEFWDTCKKEGIKPILGCETYVASRTVADKSDKVDRSGDHLILLAKNRTGYVNLIKLISVAATDGFYYKPRIDKDLLKKHSEGLIVSSSCLGGEVPQHIMNTTMEEAEETVKWFKSVFGEDYYLELQRHNSEMPELNEQVYKYQVMVNERVLQLAKKYDVKVICTNDVHFINKEDADAHDLLICLNTGKDFDDPNRMRYTKQEWFKTQAEMNELFGDVPDALRNTQDIVDKVEEFELNSSPIMPPFPIPEEFGTMEAYLEKFDETAITEEFGENSVKRNGGYEKTVRVKLESDYLEHLTYEGAYVRYGNPLPHDVKERIDFELDTIKTMGFPGYFLIVQDFIAAARNMGVLVGPGRGSAAGAAVSYCVGITNIDPIKYDLLFERFLNPDRISMPDVDIDFDDDGRQMVLDWVTEKYGQDKVAHICTFGTMATKLAIRDVARVLKLPLPDADRLAKLVPEAPKMSFEKAYKESPELAAERDSDDPLVRDTLKFASTLEGSVRQTGVHACGILISRDPLTDHIPIMPTKEEHLFTTQYDGRFVEAIGLLKMDFLGLKTLSIIKECLENIRLSKGIEVDIDSVPMDDAKTFELFSRGDTTAIFQFESPGMKKHLRNLKPNRFEDLVAMNALYRPGPMEYIPDYIERKHGRKKVEYDHPMMEKYLSDTYGITVFQEQVMLLSRHLGGFTRGDSDSLRKAMGKKIIAMMDKLKVKFVDGCKANPDFVEGCKQIGKENEIEKLVNKIWKDWEAFASYAFNKSHSVCYADIAYRTGYLKAHYPAEFMAANMSRNLSNIVDITKLMEESKRMGINVLGPDVNESFQKFTVNKKGDVRFGMAAIKGVGAGAVADIVRARDNGPFKDVFDFAERVNLQSVNKKNIEGLALAGAFDSMGMKRSQFFASAEENDAPFIEKLIKYGHQIQSESNNAMQSLFGDVMSAQAVKTPDIPKVNEFANLVLLEKEKSLIGIYLSAHPLDEYKLEFENFVSREFTLKNLNSNIDALKGREITFAGMVTEAFETVGKTGKPYSKLTLTDYEDSYTIFFFGKDYVDFGKYCKPNIFILVKGLVQESFRGGLEFRVKYIEMLEEVRKNQVKTVTVDVAIQAITPELVQNIESMSKQHKGTALLKFNLWDTETKTVVNLFSRNTRIEMNREIETFFRKQENLSFKIN